MLSHDGQPLTEAQAQQYAAFAAQYAAQIAANQQHAQQQHHISPELLQQHMQQMQQMQGPQGLQPLHPQMVPPDQPLPGQSQQPDSLAGNLYCLATATSASSSEERALLWALETLVWVRCPDILLHSRLEKWSHKSYK